MKKTCYYIISAIIFALFSSITANAATTTTVSANFTNANSETMAITNIKTMNYYPYDESTETDLGYTYSWTNNQNPLITGFTRYKYYTGVLIFRINITPSQNGFTRTMPIIYSTNITDGVRAFIEGGTADYYQITVIFDNYYPLSTELGIGTITQKFTFSTPDPPGFPLNYGFSASITNITAGTLRHTDEALDGGIAGIIADSIDNSTALAVIAGYLYDIKEQDYTYYTSLTSQISSILAAQNLTNTRLLSILNEIDLDFQQVQTILDLFPSYRTQVLQYWQQLLEMNAAQSQAAAEQSSEYADRETQSQQLLSGMNSLSMPSISAGDMDILGSVDSNQKANFFGVIGLITHTEIVTKIMLIIVLGAIVGYILYGKK